ncbi:MAG: oxidoreductase, partial [Betaproteobacteria bacterium]
MGGHRACPQARLRRAKANAGADFLDVSSGGVSPMQKISIGPGYQVAFAGQVKQSVNIPVITVGMIT